MAHTRWMFLPDRETPDASGNAGPQRTYFNFATPSATA